MGVPPEGGTITVEPESDVEEAAWKANGEADAEADAGADAETAGAVTSEALLAIACLRSSGALFRNMAEGSSSARRIRFTTPTAA